MQRFISEDPLNFTALQLLNQRVPGGIPAVGRLLQYLRRHPEFLNLYPYVTNNPLRWVDPLGLFLVHPLEDIGGGGGPSPGPLDIIPDDPFELLDDPTLPPPPILPPLWPPEELDPPPCFTVGGRKPHAC